jgi:hypothetical protein
MLIWAVGVGIPPRHLHRPAHVAGAARQNVPIQRDIAELAGISR